MVVGMSGGVDSSVAAFLLAQQDYDLSAVFMRNWDTGDESGTDKGCEWEKDWEDVQRVCKKLDLPCQMIDLSQEYWNRVFEPSLKQWESGVTPNTDVWCNREIKFGALLERLPAPTTSNKKPWIATGNHGQPLQTPPTHVPVPNSSAHPTAGKTKPTTSPQYPKKASAAPSSPSDISKSPKYANSPGNTSYTLLNAQIA